MKIKELELVNVEYFSNLILKFNTTMLNIIDDFCIFDIEGDVFKVLEKIINFLNDDYNIKPLDNNKDFSIRLVLEFENNVYEYIVLFSKEGTILTETINLNGDLYLGLNRSDPFAYPDLGKGFLARDRVDNMIDMLSYQIKLYSGEDSNIIDRKTEIALKSCPELYFKGIKMIKYINLEKNEERLYVLNNIDRRYSKNIRDKVKELIPKLFSEIIEVTYSWKFITSYDLEGDISLSNHGSGLTTVLLLLPAILSSIYENNIIICPWISGTLHHNLEKTIINFLKDSQGSGQFITNFSNIKDYESSIIYKEQNSDTII